METNYHFRGNIEGKIAICNISECCSHSTKPNEMILPSEFCVENNDCDIVITKRNFNKLEKAGKIIYKKAGKIL